MNKVVTREMLASDLPEAIRGDIDPAHTVEITVRDLGEQLPTNAPGTGFFSSRFGAARDHFRTTGEILRHVRDVRDGEDH